MAKSLEIKEISKNVECDGADPTNTRNSNAEDTIVNPSKIEGVRHTDTKDISQENGAGDKDIINANSHEEALKVVQEWCVDTKGVWLCKKCEKVFLDKQKLKRHFETHVQGLSYKCRICLQTFRSRIILASHTQRKH